MGTVAAVEELDAGTVGVIAAVEQLEAEKTVGVVAAIKGSPYASGSEGGGDREGSTSNATLFGHLPIF